MMILFNQVNASTSNHSFFKIVFILLFEVVVVFVDDSVASLLLNALETKGFIILLISL